MEIQWPLALFTLATCAASGLFAAEGVLVIGGKGRKLYMPATIVSFVLVVLGGISSFFHLQHWERIFNGFGHLSSGITQELIGLVLLVICLAVFFVMNRKTPDDEEMPKWTGVMAVIMAVVMVAIGAHAYQMAARPAWSNIGTYLYFFGSALVMGSALAWMIGSFVKEPDSEQCSLWTGVSGAIAFVCVLVFTFVAQAAQFNSFVSYYDPVAPTVDPVMSSEVITSVLFGENAVLYWGVAVVVGTIVPAIVGFIGKKAPKSAQALSLIAVICAVVGSLCFRAMFYLMGVSVYGVAF